MTNRTVWSGRTASVDYRGETTIDDYAYRDMAQRKYSCEIILPFTLRTLYDPGRGRNQLVVKARVKAMMVLLEESKPRGMLHCYSFGAYLWQIFKSMNIMSMTCTKYTNPNNITETMVLHILSII